MDQKIQVTLPNFFNVKLGNSEFELETDTLMTSLSHQYLFKTSNQTSFDNYDVLFTLVKEEISEYLMELTAKGENFVDMFGDWYDDFKYFHNTKNDPVCKDIVFSFSDGSKWAIKILDLLTLRDDFKVFKINYEDPILFDENLLFQWMSSLSWEEVNTIAEEIERPKPEPNYEEEWKYCVKEIIPWENNESLLDIFNEDDIIGLEEAPDGKPI